MISICWQCFNKKFGGRLVLQSRYTSVLSRIRWNVFTFQQISAVVVQGEVGHALTSWSNKSIKQSIHQQNKLISVPAAQRYGTGSRWIMRAHIQSACRVSESLHFVWISLRVFMCGFHDGRLFVHSACQAALGQHLKKQRTMRGRSRSRGEEVPPSCLSTDCVFAVFLLGAQTQTRRPRFRRCTES